MWLVDGSCGCSEVVVSFSHLRNKFNQTLWHQDDTEVLASISTSADDVSQFPRDLLESVILVRHFLYIIV